MTMPSPVTPCRMSYYHKPSLGLRPDDACNHPIASCSVRNVAHESHDWLDEDAPWIEPRYCWQHCEGVSLNGESDAGLR